MQKKRRREDYTVISAKEFDEKFDKGLNVDKYLDLDNPLTAEELKKLTQETLTINLTDELKTKLQQKSKELGLKLEDTIKVLLAKEVGLI